MRKESRHRSWSLPAAALGATFLAPGVARAQVELREIEGGPGATYLGKAVATIEDLDGDGVDDLLVGQPYYFDAATGTTGRALVYSGASGALLRAHVDSAATGGYFGWSLAATGDLDGDLVADYVVGAPYAGLGNEGLVVAFSGATGGKLWDVQSSQGGGLGYAVAGFDDVDGDGRGEVLASRPYDDAVDVLTSAGVLLYTVTGQPFAYFGLALSGIGDLDQDGVDEFAVGEPAYTDHSTSPPRHYVGRVRIYSGATGSILKRSFGDDAWSYYGWSLARVGDLDGDSYDDLLIGAPYADPGSGPAAGMARVRSSKQNVEIRTHLGALWNDRLGEAVAGIGDVDLDGVPDYLVGAPGVNGDLGRVTLFSGVDGRSLFEIDAESYAYFGQSLAGGDFNADGIADWAVGQPAYYDPVSGDQGAVYLFAGCPSQAESYGTGWPGTNGIPALECTIKPALGGRGEIRIGNSGTGLTFGLLFVGLTDASIPSGAGGTLLVVPTFLVPFYVYGDSTWLWSDIPDDEALCFFELYAQAIEADPGASHGLSFTEGLKLTIGFGLE